MPTDVIKLLLDPETQQSSPVDDGKSDQYAMGDAEARMLVGNGMHLLAVGAWMMYGLGITR